MGESTSATNANAVEDVSALGYDSMGDHTSDNTTQYVILAENQRKKRALVMAKQKVAQLLNENKILLEERETTREEQYVATEFIRTKVRDSLTCFIPSFSFLSSLSFLSPISLLLWFVFLSHLNPDSRSDVCLHVPLHLPPLLLLFALHPLIVLPYMYMYTPYLIWVNVLDVLDVLDVLHMMWCIYYYMYHVCIGHVW